MTNNDKAELRQLAKEGLSFKEIRRIVNCADSTIRQYIKTFSPLGHDRRNKPSGWR